LNPAAGDGWVGAGARAEAYNATAEDLRPMDTGSCPPDHLKRNQLNDVRFREAYFKWGARNWAERMGALAELKLDDISIAAVDKAWEEDGWTERFRQYFTVHWGGHYCNKHGEAT